MGQTHSHWDEKNINEFVDQLKDLKTKIDDEASSNRIQINKLLANGICDHIDGKTTLNVQSSIDYLSNKATIDELCKLLNKMKIDELFCHIRETLGIVYLELIATAHDYDRDKKYLINLYPCDKCACFGVEKI